jgi:gamma-glutamyltranspeptidase/glutathione hydrolase
MFNLKEESKQLFKQAEDLLYNHLYSDQKGMLKIQKTDLAKIFLKPDGNLYREGDRLIQPQLASTLRQISQGGANTFYRGKIATDIVNSSNKGGGILTQEDFTQYRIKQSKPLYCNYRGYQIITTPPPGGGIVLCELLNILEGYPLQKTGLKTPLSLHWFLDAMFYAFQDRNMYLGDPDFVKIPIERLSSKKYAAKLRELIPVYYAASNPQKNTKLPIDGQTTHYSVVDRYGNAVSVTYTLNSYFGAGVMAQNTGFILNNEMDDFTTELGKVNQFGLKQGSNNLIQPGKQPLSSMTPTIVKKNNHLFLVTGSPGGSTIITTVLQIITNIIDYQFPLDKAVNQPRIHYQGIPNYVMLEKNGLPQSTISALETRGYIFNKTMSNWGAAETILRDSNGLLEGVNDYRKPAGAALAE